MPQTCDSVQRLKTAHLIQANVANMRRMANVFETGL